MKLDDRIYGSQMAEIEKEILFNLENIGFVRFDGNSRRTFFQDPSPFKKTNKNEVCHLINGQAPSKNELVKVHVIDKKVVYEQVIDGFSKTIIKIIDSWEPVDVNTITRSRSIIDYEEVINYLQMPYKGDKDISKCIGLGSAMYINSTPPCGREIGGINAAVLGKQKIWNAYTGSMNSVIPSDFRKLSSDYFYRISDQDKVIDIEQKREFSLSVLNPKITPMQIPLILDVDDVKSRKQLNKDCKEDYPVLNAYLIDSLLMKPSISGSLDGYIVEKTYEFKNDIIDMGGLSYNHDLGSSLPLMVLAYARLLHKTECSKDDLNEVFEFCMEMIHWTNRELSTPLYYFEQYSLKGDEETLYKDLCNAFGTDIEVSIEEAKKATVLNEFVFDDVLQKLSIKGLVLLINNYTKIRILCRI